EFIPDAIERGAEYVVCSPDACNLSRNSGATIIKCRDPREALGELARAHYHTGDFEYKLIGITGTNGKTTISYLLEHVLQKSGWHVGVIGTVSYRCNGFVQQADLTTPDCLQTHELLSRMGKEGVDMVCMEVSSHALDQGRVKGLKFDLAVFSNLTQDHLDYHQQMETYFQTKSSLFDTQNGKKPVAVINLDDDYGQRLAGEKEAKWGYTLLGNCSGVNSCLQGRLQKNSRKGLELELWLQDSKWTTSSPLIGDYNASNVLAVQAAGLELGLDVKQLQKIIPGFTGVPGRLEKIPNSRGLHIILDYAHTPDALQKLLTTVSKLDFDKIVVLFGCGGDRDKKKRPHMGRVVSEYADKIVLTSDNPRNEDPGSIISDILPGIGNTPEVQQIEDRRRAIRAAISDLGERDVLIIAGKGHEDCQQIGEEKVEFNDAAVVREFV
ncbi:MAG: UDP-N-acetylmuramoyl-L-alanyl-D-glutamate--2,6-diaminopimelate ligase, partial [Thermodesulfobacteriota bacterium]